MAQLATRHLISDTAVQRYSAGPGPLMVTRAVALHTELRDFLGPNYDTFLQGSYKNDTGRRELNDVDVVALRVDLHSTVFNRTPGLYTVTWEEIFTDVYSRLITGANGKYKGRTTPGDKCITVDGDYLHADVVPAVWINSTDSDPISIYSWRTEAERKNYPRDHYRRNVEKQGRTPDSYKATVRMFKQWATNWFSDKKLAPSFYIECLVHHVPDARFKADLAESFESVGIWIVQNVNRYSAVMSVAGDKDILMPDEWAPEKYEQFRNHLVPSLALVNLALRATNQSDANRLWRAAFNE